MTTELVTALENLINDETRMIKMPDSKKNNFVSILGVRNAFVSEKILFADKGTLLYYGIAYELFDSKDLAVYKSLDNKIYYIESLNSVPYRYYRLDDIMY
jgi:hypothetical protein